MENLTKEQINSIVMEIMIKDGPDGHTDGSDVITDFIIATKNNKLNHFLRTKRYLIKYLKYIE